LGWTDTSGEEKFLLNQRPLFLPLKWVTLSVLVVAGSVLWVATMAALAIALRRWSSPELP
jgi:hypothetical protein